MSKFQPLSFYETTLAAGYKLLPLRFSNLAGDEYILTNAVGEHAVLPRAELVQLVEHRMSPREATYKTLKSKHFLYDQDSDVALDLLALKTRTRLAPLRHFTALHMFVVTLRCEHSCPYCQVSRQSDDRVAYDMTAETAEAALALVFKSPSPSIKIEFQGGEPMLNFERIAHIVSRAKEINTSLKRDLQFVIATNLAMVTDDILSFCKDHGVLISTSLDGPKDLHNKNRPRPGHDSHERAVAGIGKARDVLGKDRVSALMTTTLGSLGRAKDIVDEYVRLEFDDIFLRALSPYGFAVKTKFFDAYNLDAWLNFYFQGLDYIIEINKSGRFFSESYASLILKKILTPLSTGYVDLMSPAGIGIAGVVYNYDGDVYASDEGRMLAEMGNKAFRLGNVSTDAYGDIFLSDQLLDPIEQSFAASAPMCSECAFEPFCGAEPVYHMATQGEYVGRKPESDFCNRNMAIFRGLIQRMRADPETEHIFRRWVAR